VHRVEDGVRGVVGGVRVREELGCPAGVEGDEAAQQVALLVVQVAAADALGGES